jgi:hypothetical protein
MKPKKKDVKEELKQELKESLEKELEKQGKECLHCNTIVSKPFATINMGEENEKFEVHFCSPRCFNEDQIKQTMHLLTAHSDRFFANKFKELAELRLGVLENNDKMTIAQGDMLMN